MIAKIPPKRSDGKTNFRALSEYIADAEKTQGQVWTYNTLDPDTAASEMTASALLNTRVKDPAFHAVLSWPEGERPTPAQARAAGEEALKALGFDLGEGGHQALIALHLDTDNIHIHLAANRVHPEHGKAVDLWKSKERLHSACRAIELAQGWSHDRGLAQVVKDDQGQGSCRALGLPQRGQGRALESGARPRGGYGGDLVRALCQGQRRPGHA